VQLSFEDHDLVAEGEDLRVLSPIAHGQQSQHRERVGHPEVGESKQHDWASSPSHRRRSEARCAVGSDKIFIVVVNGL
jgi:hypothetical protein